MRDSDLPTYPVMAMADIWHAAADAIAGAAVTDVDEAWLIALARFIHQQIATTPGRALVFSITIHFDDEEQADVARRYVRRAVDAGDRHQ
jgi:hypothetical protein